MLRLLLVLSVVLGLGVGVSDALAGEGSPPNPRELCTKGHWQQVGFTSESKCLNFLQSAQTDCKSAQATFGADNQTGLSFSTLLWTCNGDGILNDDVLDMLNSDCFHFGEVSVVNGKGTGGVTAYSCFRF